MPLCASPSTGLFIVSYMGLSSCELTKAHTFQGSHSGALWIQLTQLEHENLLFSWLEYTLLRNEMCTCMCRLCQIVSILDPVD